MFAGIYTLQFLILVLNGVFTEESDKTLGSMSFQLWPLNNKSVSKSQCSVSVSVVRLKQQENWVSIAPENPNEEYITEVAPSQLTYENI